MTNDDLIYVGHMLDTAERIIQKVQRRPRSKFDKDENLRLALAHLVQVVGEAAAHVSEDFCARYPAVPWKAIAGMRHKVMHDYLGVDEEMVWDTARREIRPVAKQLREILRQSGEAESAG